MLSDYFYYAIQFPDESCKTKIRCGNLLSLSLSEASRIAFAADKDNSPHQRICEKPTMAVHTNDVVLLSSSSCLGKFCENLPMKIISITPFAKKVLPLQTTHCPTEKHQQK